MIKFFIFIVITTTFISLSIKADSKKIPNNQSRIILHDGMFNDGLPSEFWLDDSKKIELWGWGNWKSKSGKANIWFSQQGPTRILTELGMLPKKVLKNWGVENYKLGKKKGFKSSGYRALVQLVRIDDKNCVVIISRFGSSTDSQNRVRSGIEGYICKNNEEITIDDGKNFMHCIELKGEGTHYVGRKIDNNCIYDNSLNDVST